MKKFLMACLLASSFSASAALDYCEGVYVGRIAIHAQRGIDKVVFLSGKSSTSGSYWVNFTNWDRDAKKEALSILLAAKASGHKVNVYTFAEDGCSIGKGAQTLSEVHMATNP